MTAGAESVERKAVRTRPSAAGRTTADSSSDTDTVVALLPTAHQSSSSNTHKNISRRHFPVSVYLCSSVYQSVSLAPAITTRGPSSG